MAVQRALAQSRPHAVGAQVILASADGYLKAGMLRTLKGLLSSREMLSVRLAQSSWPSHIDLNGTEI